MNGGTNFVWAWIAIVGPVVFCVWVVIAMQHLGAVRREMESKRNS